MWDSLTDEQKEKAKQCQSMDELLDSVAGGFRPKKEGVHCPYCGKTANPVAKQDKVPKTIGGKAAMRYYCAGGGHGFYYAPSTQSYYDNNEDKITPVSSGC